MRCEDCTRDRCRDCGMHFCCEPCDCGKSHACECDCAAYERWATDNT